MSTIEVVEATWKEIGYRIRPLKQTVFVRAEAPSDMIGSLYKPMSLQGFYAGMPNAHLIPATVLSAGPDAEVKSGDRICFQRLYFARLVQLEDKSVVGWLQGPNISGYLDGKLDDSLVPGWTKVPGVVKSTADAPRAVSGLQ